MVMCLLCLCHTCSLSFLSVWTSCCSQSTSVPRSSNAVLISKVTQSIKRWKFHLLQSFWFVLCLVLSVSGCHRGQDQLRTTFQSGSLKQQLFQKEENITRGICKWNETGKAESIQAATVSSHSYGMLSSESHQSLCVYPSSNNKQVFQLYRLVESE